jgi:hypothetical protein
VRRSRDVPVSEFAVLVVTVYPKVAVNFPGSLVVISGLAVISISG